MRETIGQYIKRLRTEQGKTLTQLAAALDLDSGALSKIENGKRTLPQKLLPKLAKTFALDLPTLKKEYYSEAIARMMYDNECDSGVLQLAEEKVGYIRTKNTKQANLSFDK